MASYQNQNRRMHPRVAGARGLRFVAAALGVAVITATLSACDASATPDGESSADAGGVSAPADLPDYVAGGAPGKKPDLPRVIGYAQLGTNEYDTDILEGLQAGAADTDLQVRAAVSDGDPQRQAQNTTQFLTSGVASIVSVALDPAAQAPSLIDAIGSGVAVQSIVFGPSTTQANVPQYEAGRALAETAADFINTELSGSAKVAIFNLDSVAAIQPRYQAMRDVLGEIPGVQIVSDQQPAGLDSESAFATMSTILQQDPGVNVVLGDDFFALGAMSAMEAAGVDLSKVFIGGINASAEARNALTNGGPYRATVTTSPAIMAYAMARQTADWLDGRAVPQGICIQPLVLTPDGVSKYTADMSDLRGVYEDPERLSQYLAFKGEISFDSHDQWFNDAWAPTSCGN